MPTLQLTFTEPINTSVQIGDMVYYVPTNPTGTFDTAPLNNATEIGEVTSIINQTGSVLGYQTTDLLGNVVPGSNTFATNANVPPFSLLGMSISGPGFAPGTTIISYPSPGVMITDLASIGFTVTNATYSFFNLPKINVFDPTAPINVPNVGDFIMFAKNRAVNTSGIIGYYADIKLSNNSRDKAEMFSIASGVIESSK